MLCTNCQAKDAKTKGFCPTCYQYSLYKPELFKKRTKRPNLVVIETQKPPETLEALVEIAVTCTRMAQEALAIASEHYGSETARRSYAEKTDMEERARRRS